MLSNFSKEHELYLKRIKKQKKIILFSQISILVVAVVLWELASRFGWIDSFLTSSPSEIFMLFKDYFINNNLVHHIGVSLGETIAGFVLGTLFGIIVAIILWWSDFLRRVMDPYLVILNSLPKTALAPIFIILFGAGYKGIIATAISISIVVTIMNMLSSYLSVEEDKIRLLKTLGATKFQILQKLIIPASIPDLISTLKVNIGLSWVGVIVGEFLVSKAGLGYLIVYGMQVFRMDLVMMNVVVLSIISVLMYKIIALLEKKISR